MAYDEPTSSVKIIHKYVLREHAGPLLFALSALTSLLLLNYVAKQFGNLVGKGLPWTVIAEFFGLSVPFTFAMTFPMAVLVATLYAFSRLAAENEITALKASGVSLTRLIAPALIAASFLSIGMILFNDQVLPRANHRLRTLQGDIARKKPTFALREQVINEVSPGRLFLKAGHLDEFTNRMRDVTIYDMGDPLRRRTIYADSGFMEFAPNAKDLILTLHHGQMIELSKQNPLELQRLYYETDYVRVPDVANQFDATSDDSFKSDREMSVCELQNEVARSEIEFDRASADLRQALVNAAREAATGQPGAMPSDPSLALPVTPGAPAPRSSRASLGRVYCDASAALVRRFQSLASLSLPGVSTAWAATLTQDTVRKKTAPDSARPAPVTAADTSQGRKDSTHTDSAARPNPKINPATIVPNVYPQLPPSMGGNPAPPAGQPGAAVVPDSSPYGGGVGQPAGMDSSTMPRLLPTGTIVPSMPFVASAAVEGASSRMMESLRQVNQNAVELHKKFAISVACVVFVLIGAPIALRFPRGGVGLVIGASLVVFALYYVGLIAGETLADNNIVPPALAMWSANIILTIVGVALMARVGREGATARGGDLHEIVDAIKGLRRLLPFHRDAGASA